MLTFEVPHINLTRDFLFCLINLPAGIGKKIGTFFLIVSISEIQKSYFHTKNQKNQSGEQNEIIIFLSLPIFMLLI